MTINKFDLTCKLFANATVPVGLATSSLIPVLNRDYSESFAVGTGANQVATRYCAIRTLGGATETLDLAGVLTDEFGDTITFAAIKAIAVYNSDDAAITIDTTISNGWTAALNGVITLAPGALLLLVDPSATGWAVTAGTGDLIEIGGTTGKTYEIVIFGK